MFSNLGICLSYDRVLEITKELSNTQIHHYLTNNVFAPSPLRKSVFIVIAKDNIDCNATSSTAVRHFHGTCMTVMQFISAEISGTKYSFTEDVGTVKDNVSTNKVLKIPESFSNVEQL